MKRFKYLFKLIWGDSYAGIPDGYLKAKLSGFGIYYDLAILRCEFNRVIDQLEDRPGQALPIQANQWELLVVFPDQRDAGLLRFGL